MSAGEPVVSPTNSHSFAWRSMGVLQTHEEFNFTSQSGSQLRMFLDMSISLKVGQRNVPAKVGLYVCKRWFKCQFIEIQVRAEKEKY